jgi:hypothetical protein
VVAVSRASELEGSAVGTARLQGRPTSLDELIA